MANKNIKTYLANPKAEFLWLSFFHNLDKIPIFDQAKYLNYVQA